MWSALQICGATAGREGVTAGLSPVCAFVPRSVATCIAIARQRCQSGGDDEYCLGSRNRTLGLPQVLRRDQHGFSTQQCGSRSGAGNCPVPVSTIRLFNQEPAIYHILHTGRTGNPDCCRVWSLNSLRRCQYGSIEGVRSGPDVKVNSNTWSRRVAAGLRFSKRRCNNDFATRPRYRRCCGQLPTLNGQLIAAGQINDESVAGRLISGVSRRRAEYR